VNPPNDLQTNASLLLLEIGNSHVTVATDIAGQLRSQHRFGHDQLDQVLDCAGQSWDALPDDRIKSIAAASVVPRILSSLRGRLGERFESPLLAVGQELHRPLSLAVEAPEKVGVDRVCAAAAAYEVLSRACVIASFGTAITIDCVNDEGVFMGGAILPGIGLQARILHEATAALPLVRIDDAAGVFGASTEHAIRNGVIYGAVGALREITERYATELHAWPQLVLTGGNASLVSRHCDFFDSVVPDLCLRGIALAYRRHFAAFDDD
jgi:type III pantothenate kinase